MLVSLEITKTYFISP